jgi:hypothetical protein
MIEPILFATLLRVVRIIISTGVSRKKAMSAVMRTINCFYAAKIEEFIYFDLADRIVQTFGLGIFPNPVRIINPDRVSFLMDNP